MATSTTVTPATDNYSKNGILVAIGTTVVVGVIGATFSPANSINILGFCSVVCVSLFGLLQQKQAEKKTARKVEEVAVAAKDTADKVESVRKTAVIAADQVIEVKESLKETAKAANEKLTELTNVALDSQKTGKSVHLLVNSSMSLQLKISALALRRVADLTTNKDDEAAATLAEQSYREHENKQDLVDAKDAKDEMDAKKKTPS